jgi:hypothetical protein
MLVIREYKGTDTSSGVNFRPYFMNILQKDNWVRQGTRTYKKGTFPNRKRRWAGNQMLPSTK